MARLDDAVMRILRLKARVGLLAGGGMVAPRLAAAPAHEGSRRLADEIAARGLTLVRDRGGLLPLGAAGADQTVVVTLLDKDERAGNEGAGDARARVARGSVTSRRPVIAGVGRQRGRRDHGRGAASWREANASCWRRTSRSVPTRKRSVCRRRCARWSRR
jgi:beta-glucosidase-like glycosyl hydrolase